MTATPIGSLSLDLDDEWAYRRSLGDPDWHSRTSYFDVLGPRLSEVLAGRRATCFAVGADARRPGGGRLLRALRDAGHEIASHSDQHDVRLHRRTAAEIADDLERAATAIAGAVGTRPVGFRSPGYGTSRALTRVLVSQGYAYDASALPSPAAALARVWFGRHESRPALTARAVRDQLAELSAGMRVRGVDGGDLIEVPVTVMPYLRLPIHASHVLVLARRSPRLAARYLDVALALCERRGIGPALVIHPTDLLDSSDSPALAAFPAMGIPAARKLVHMRTWLGLADARFALGTVSEQAAAARRVTAPSPGARAADAVAAVE